MQVGPHFLRWYLQAAQACVVPLPFLETMLLLMLLLLLLLFMLHGKTKPKLYNDQFCVRLRFLCTLQLFWCLFLALLLSLPIFQFGFTKLKINKINILIRNNDS
jgi:hypothetical protein